MGHLGLGVSTTQVGMNFGVCTEYGAMPPEQAVFGSLPASRLAGLRRKLCQAIAAFEDTGDTSSDAACLIPVRLRNLWYRTPGAAWPARHPSVTRSTLCLIRRCLLGYRCPLLMFVRVCHAQKRLLVRFQNSSPCSNSIVSGGSPTGCRGMITGASQN